MRFHIGDWYQLIVSRSKAVIYQELCQNEYKSVVHFYLFGDVCRKCFVLL